MLTRFSLAQQLVLLALLPAIVATMGAIAVLTRQHLGSVNNLMRANGQTVALQVAAMAQTPLARMDRRALLRAAQSGSAQPQVQRVQIWTHDGEIVADAASPESGKAEGLQVVAPVVSDDGSPTGKVMVEISLDAVQKAKNSVWFNVFVVLAASLIGVGLAAWWAARRISASIRELGEAVD